MLVSKVSSACIGHRVAFLHPSDDKEPLSAISPNIIDNGNISNYTYFSQFSRTLRHLAEMGGGKSTKWRQTIRIVRCFIVRYNKKGIS